MVTRAEHDARRRPPESNFRYLFVGVVSLLVLEPIGDVAFGRSYDRVLGILLTILLLVGIWGLNASRLWLRVGRALVATGLVLGVATALWPVPLLQATHSMVVGLFFVLSAAIGLRQILARGPVTVDHLLGAMTVYLLLGLTWALVLSTVNRLAPASFTGLSTGSGSEFMYLSFVTLATLGFGDITPVHPIARTLVYLEAVVGQLYVAVLVASLVSRHVAGRPE